MVLANVASRCEYAYGGMGRVGFLYESMKDNLKWNDLDVKYYVHMLSSIGRVLSLSEDEYKKQKAKNIKASSDEIINTFSSIFGDGL